MAEGIDFKGNLGKRSNVHQKILKLNELSFVNLAKGTNCTFGKILKQLSLSFYTVKKHLKFKYITS